MAAMAAGWHSWTLIEATRANKKKNIPKTNSVVVVSVALLLCLLSIFSQPTIPTTHHLTIALELYNE